MSQREAERLTEREHEVAQLIAKGFTNAEIARRLGISFGTAKWHVSQVLAKTGADGRGALRTRLRTHGWFGLPVAKLLAVTTFTLPVAGLAAAGAIVLSQRQAPQPANSDIRQAMSVQPAAPAADQPVATPAGTVHSCTPALTIPLGSVGPADHSGCDFTDFEFGAAYLNGANFTGTTLTGAAFTGATLGGANLTSAQAQRAKFHSSILQNANFDNTDLTGVDFTDSIVTGATFRGAICPDGLPAATRGNTCLNTPGLQNLPVTRSLERSRQLIGQQARAFSLPDMANPGRAVSLADFAGRPVVLWWFASWCGQCETQAIELAQVARQYPGLAVLPLSMDANPAAAAALLRQAGFEGAWVVDSDNAVATNFGVVGISGAVVVDGQGLYRGLEFPSAPGAFTDLLTRAAVIP